MRAFFLPLPVACLVAAASCSGNSSSGSPGSSGALPDASAGDASLGQNATVTVFDQTLFAFQGAPGGARRQTASAAFPPAGTYQKISLHIQLDCPTGGCDHWDRVGSLGIVTAPATDGGSPGTVVEVARWITPFCSNGAWDYDVTDLAPLLTGGNLTFQGFIDTWVPQGNPSANGAGWLLTATFSFTAGVPAKLPVANLPVWPWPANSDPPNSAQYGDPSDPISTHMSSPTITLPAGASSYALRSFITGHGQGNGSNCAEFCMTTHTVTIGSTAFPLTPWRDCSMTPGGARQCGTWMYPRSGWCPGASVDPWIQDVTSAVTGATATFAYNADSYVNACRPDAPTCDMTQCVAGTACAFNGSSHTEPFFYISSLLIAYR